MHYLTFTCKEVLCLFFHNTIKKTGSFKSAKAQKGNQLSVFFDTVQNPYVYWIWETFTFIKYGVFVHFLFVMQAVLQCCALCNHR